MKTVSLTALLSIQVFIGQFVFAQSDGATDSIVVAPPTQQSNVGAQEVYEYGVIRHRVVAQNGSALVQSFSPAGALIRLRPAGAKESSAFYNETGIEEPSAQMQTFLDSRFVQKTGDLILGITEHPRGKARAHEKNEQPYLSDKRQGQFRFEREHSTIPVARSVNRTFEVTYTAGLLDGPTRAYYPSGAAMIYANYRSGVLEGEYERYAPEAKGKRADDKPVIVEKGTYKDGALDGSVTVFSEDGRKKYQLSFSHGQLDGESVLYGNSQRVKARCNYSQGMRNGNCVVYSESGQILTEASFRNGEPNGKWRETFDHGSPKMEANYENGQLVTLVEYHSNGKMARNETYKDGKLDGVSKTFYTDGKLREESNYVAGKREGEQRAYFRNGNIESKLNYAAGLAEGEQYYYYDTGQLKEKKRMAAGREVGWSEQRNRQGVFIGSGKSS